MTSVDIALVLLAIVRAVTGAIAGLLLHLAHLLLTDPQQLAALWW